MSFIFLIFNQLVYFTSWFSVSQLKYIRKKTYTAQHTSLTKPNPTGLHTHKPMKTPTQSPPFYPLHSTVRFAHRTSPTSPPYRNRSTFYTPPNSTPPPNIPHSHPIAPCLPLPENQPSPPASARPKSKSKSKSKYLKNFKTCKRYEYIPPPLLEDSA